MARLKVFSGLLMGEKRAQERAIIRASSRKAAAAVVQCSLYEFTHWWAETGNEIELAEAEKHPPLTLLQKRGPPYGDGEWYVVRAAEEASDG